jgi:hypothetical protein
MSIECNADSLRQFGSVELCRWLRDHSGLGERKLKAAIKAIMEQDIEGSNFLNFSLEQWVTVIGLSAGTADSLVQIAQRVLNNSKQFYSQTTAHVIFSSVSERNKEIVQCSCG